MKVTAVGVGYVGLVAAACLADSGNHVVCVDSDANKIDDLKKGIIPIYEPGLAEIVRHNVEGKRLHFTTSPEGVSHGKIILLGVGTLCRGWVGGYLGGAGRVRVDRRTDDRVPDHRCKSTVPPMTHRKALS
jgi:UDP-glucose 6-dehydrogenase